MALVGNKTHVPLFIFSSTSFIFSNLMTPQGVFARMNSTPAINRHTVFARCGADTLHRRPWLVVLLRQGTSRLMALIVFRAAHFSESSAEFERATSRKPSLWDATRCFAVPLMSKLYELGSAAAAVSLLAGSS